MLLAVLSDIHDNLANLEKCLNWCRAHKVETIINCGDTTTLETINYLAANFRGEIFMVDGNGEIYETEELKKFQTIKYRGELGQEIIGGLRIGFCHEPHKIKRVLALAPAAPDFIFYGHTHTPGIERRGTTTVANPGNLAGIFHQATFATLDTETKELELKIVADLS